MFLAVSRCSKKAIRINFAKFAGKQLYSSLFLDKVLGLKFKKRLAGGLFQLNTLYLLRRPRPKNVTLDLAYSLIINYSRASLKQTSSKPDTSLRRTKNLVPDEFLRNPL